MSMPDDLDGLPLVYVVSPIDLNAFSSNTPLFPFDKSSIFKQHYQLDLHIQILHLDLNIPNI